MSENEKEEKQDLGEKEILEYDSLDRSSWKGVKVFAFSFVLFIFAYWLGANQSKYENTFLGKILEKGGTYIENVTMVSDKEQIEPLTDSEVLSKNVLDQEDTSMDFTQTQMQVQEEPQMLQYQQDKGIPQFHIVAKGDTLRSISMYYYGDYDMIDAICQLNQIEDSNCIECGQTLFLP